jgi:hypothetical protein
MFYVALPVVFELEKQGLTHPPKNKSLPPTFTDFTTFPPSFLLP